ncbi:MAG: peptidoglycan-binding domain-containing protein [Mobilitalea sp.]
MTKLTGVELAEHCKSKLGTPYVYGAKGSYGKLTQPYLNSLILAYSNIFTNMYVTKARRLVGQVCTDCSGLISWYTKKTIGSYQMYKTAVTKELITTVDKAPIGAVLWRIGHVGVKIDDDYCIEAKGIDYGTVQTKISSTKFTHWLLFEYMNYEIPLNTSKTKNPYKEPTEIITKGSISEGVKWVQWELNDAGIKVEIDGDCGPITYQAIKSYQQSCKIVVDGKVGPTTRKAFKCD